MLWEAVVRPCHTAALPACVHLLLLQNEHGKGVGGEVLSGMACMWTSHTGRSGTGPGLFTVLRIYVIQRKHDM